MSSNMSDIEGANMSTVMSGTSDEKGTTIAAVQTPSVDGKGAGSESGSSAIDTVHNDEALRILARYDGERTWDAKEEGSLRRKVDWRLMPILCITYGLQYYDKNIISQAALFGLRKDLNLIGDRYLWSSSMYALGFISGAIPTIFVAQRFKTEYVAAGLVFLWGLCLLLTAACTDYKGMYTQRFFLGFLESGIGPILMLVVGSWYKKDEQAVRQGIWYSFSGYFSIISPLINYGFGLVHGPVSSWKYMYYFAGGLTMLWGISLIWILPPDPIRARGLNDRERYILVSRLQSNNSGIRNTHIKMEQVTELLLDVKFWLVFFTAVLSMLTNAPISTFIPILINSFGFSTLNSLLLVSPAGFYAGTTAIIFTYVAYKVNGSRSYLMVAGLLTTLASLIMLRELPLSAKGALMVAIILMPTCTAGFAVLMGQQLANTAGYTKRSLTAATFHLTGALGTFIGLQTFRDQDKPRFIPGFTVLITTTSIAIVLSLIYRFVCVWENNKRDKAGILEGYDHAFEDDLTDKKNPQFRYTL